MPHRVVRILDEVPAPLAAGFRALVEELKVPESFPRDVLDEAGLVAREPVIAGGAYADATGIEFVTIDPPASTDLDQALCLERRGDGYRVYYAIADVAAFVRPGAPLDAETHRRGETLYAPNLKTPLHPPVLSDDAASLLPGQERPALLWRVDLDAAGEIVDASVSRARVRSRAKLDYAGVQRRLDAGTAGPMLDLLPVIGRLRQEREIARGGVSLNVPEQEVDAEGAQWTLRYRVALPVEDFNAQISLLTGIAAAQLMLRGRVGLLRTLPPADPSALARLRRTAAALGIEWPPDEGYPEFVRSLDPSRGAGAAMASACTALFRGAGYVAFNGEVPAEHVHAALATPYAHVTAPLRRLGDRYAGEICVALCAGSGVPEWVTQALDAVPAELAESGRRAKAYERGIVDLVEALVLRDRVGETFTGTVIEADERGGVLLLADPAVEARVDGSGLVLGAQVPARLASVDLQRRAVRFVAGIR